MSFYWSGRGFVKRAGAAAGRAAQNLGGSLTAPPSTSSKNPQSFQNYQRWQTSQSHIGTQKYWTDEDDSAKSIGGAGINFSREQYNLRDIGIRSTGKPMRRRTKEAPPTPEEEKVVDMEPPDDPEEERARLGLNPGKGPFGALGPGDQLGALGQGTPGGDLDWQRGWYQSRGASTAIDPQKALPAGPAQKGGSDDGWDDSDIEDANVVAVNGKYFPGQDPNPMKEIGGQPLAIGPAGNPGATGTSHTDQTRQKSRRQNDLLSKSTPTGDSTPWSGGRRMPGLGIYGAGLANENMDEHYEGKPLPKSATGIGQSIDTGKNAPNNNAGIGVFGRTPSETDNTQNAGVGLFGKTASGPGEATPPQDMEPLTQPTYTAPRNMSTSRRSGG